MSQLGFTQLFVGTPSSTRFDLVRKGNNAVLSNNNFTLGNTTGNSVGCVDVGITSGKRFFEITVGTIGADIQIGLVNSSATAAADFNSGRLLGATTNAWGYISGVLNGKVTNNATTAFGVTTAPGDRLSLALDLTFGFLYCAKNGIFMNSGNPLSGSSGTGNMFSISIGPTYYFAANVWGAGNTVTITSTIVPPTGYTRI